MMGWIHPVPGSHVSVGRRGFGPDDARSIGPRPGRSAGLRLCQRPASAGHKRPSFGSTGCGGSPLRGNGQPSGGPVLRVRRTAVPARVTARTGRDGSSHEVDERRYNRRCEVSSATAHARPEMAAGSRLERQAFGPRVATGFPQRGFGAVRGDDTTGRGELRLAAIGRVEWMSSRAFTHSGWKWPDPSPGRCPTRSEDPREGGDHGQSSLGVSFCGSNDPTAGIP